MVTLREHIIKVYCTVLLGIAISVYTAMYNLKTVHTNVWLAISLLSIICIIINDDILWCLLLYLVFSISQGLLFSQIEIPIDGEIMNTAFYSSIVMFISLCVFSTFIKSDVLLMASTGAMVWLFILVSGSIFNLFDDLFLKFDIYFGLMVFSLYTMLDTVKMVKEFNEGQYNYVHHAIMFYIDILNIFVRIILLLSR